MANSWWEIQILADPNLEETIFWRLQTFGCQGTAGERQKNGYLLRAYLPEAEAHLLDLSALSLWLRQDALCLGLNVPEVHWRLIDEEDWASSWKKYWHPTEIGDRFLVYPGWLPPPENSDRLLLRLDPGVAFGTGTHPTTKLCLEALEMRLGIDAEKQTIADIGCGSGILSIGALLLGAKTVYAVDTDSLAIKATRSNRAMNQMSEKRLIAKKGSLPEVKQMVPQPVDGILCNILAEVIIDLIPHLDEIAHSSTWGIISGVLVDQAKPVADTLEQHGWIVATLWRRQDWCCFNIRRS